MTFLTAPGYPKGAPPSPPGGQRRLRWAVGLSPLLLGGFALFIVPGPEDDLPASTERIARGRLIQTARAQERFRAGAGSATPSFWRADLAGLYTASPSNPASAPIELPLALADDRPSAGRPSLGPRAALTGYWYRSILFEGEGTPDPGHFAVCAYPETYRASGRFTLIVSDRGVVWMKDLGMGGGIELFPRDPLRDHWRRID